MEYIKNYKYFIVGILLFSFNTNAAYTCSGEVKGVSIEPTNGHVLVERIGPLVWSRLCSVSDDYNGVKAETCKTIYSTLLTAQTTQKPVTMWFNDGKNCSQHPAWNPLTGWYFGPRLN